MLSSLKIAYLGPPGTYTGDAARAVAPGCTLIACGSIDAVFTAVCTGDAERGVVPIENVIQGVITETLDNLYQHADAIKIVDAVVLCVEHAIGVLTPAAHVTRVLSKDQALRQCAKYLKAHHPDALLQHTASTAAAVHQVADEKLHDAAAIGHAETLRALGLHTLARNIGDIKNNKTRFVVLAGAKVAYAEPSGADVTSLAIYPHHDRVGLLQDILTIISRKHGLSCSSIHSRPDTHGAFRFYLEIEGHLHNAAVASCLIALRTVLEDAACDIILFGSYPQRAFNTRRINTVGIIGGTGQMGRWFATFFRQAGYQVLLSGRKTELTYAQCVAQSDVVLINVPIAHTAQTITHVAPMLRPGQLLVDNTSIKTEPVAAMVAAAAPGVEVLGMHTVFGPGIASLHHQNIIFTETPAAQSLSQEFEAIFHKHGARITRTTPELHDKHMALHQNLEHFSKIVLAELIHTHFKEPTDLDRYASPNSRASLATLGRILAGDAALYADIQAHNSQGTSLIAAYAALTTQLAQALERGDVQRLKDSLEHSKQTLGEKFVRTQAERSERMANMHEDDLLSAPQFKK